MRTRQIVLNNIVRSFTRRLTDSCHECEGSVLEKLIRKAESGDKSPLCRKCKRLFYFTEGLNFFLKALGVWTVNKSTLVATHKTGYRSSSYIRGVYSIFRGIAIFGLRQPLITAAPISVILEFTRLCNLKCPHCYMNTYLIESDRTRLHELSTEEWLNCIDSLSDAGVVSITFSGGEPLLREDFFKVAEYASSKGLSSSLATNGMMIDKETVKKLKEVGIGHVEISLSSAKKDSNDALRGKGSFEKTINAAKYCMEEGMTVGLAITLTKQTKDEIEEFLELAKNIGVDLAVFLNFLPVGHASGSKNLDLDPYESEELLKTINKKRQAYDSFFRKIVVLQATHIARVCYDMTEDKKNFVLQQIGFIKLNNPGRGNRLKYVGGCAAGRFLAAISPEGEIMPCPFLRLKLGNIKKDNFFNIWLSDTVLNKLRDRENWNGNCGKCNHKIVCGGCRARAYTYSGDFLESDPGCILNAKPTNR